MLSDFVADLVSAFVDGLEDLMAMDTGYGGIVVPVQPA